MGSPGVALFSSTQLCSAAALPSPEAWRELAPGKRWLEVAKVIAEWARKEAHRTGGTTVESVIFEKPQWYPRGKSKVDPNGLVGIAGVAANVTGMLLPHDVLSPTPAEWIGQLPKVCTYCEGRKTAPRTDGRRGRGVTRICKVCNSTAWGTPRGVYIKKRLRAEEIARCPDQNDAIDAVGLGLWSLGRLQPVSVFSNGNDGR
jgi:hypothetical protein